MMTRDMDDGAIYWEAIGAACDGDLRSAHDTGGVVDDASTHRFGGLGGKGRLREQQRDQEGTHLGGNHDW